jgi:hypothetical protein
MRAALTIIATAIVALSATATPIRPNVQKLLSQPQEPPPQFVPARAGWDGPEVAKASAAPVNPALETFGEAATARAVREAMVGAAVPDWRAWALIGACILLLRWIRRPRRPVPLREEQTIELRPAA